MGGAILSLKAKTQDELNKRVEKTIRQAEHMGLSDLRSIEFFEPGTYVKPNGKPEGNWVAVIWVHS